LLDDGIVMDLGDDVEGFVPRSHVDVPSGEDLPDYVHDGMELPLRVIEFDAANRRIVLTATSKLEKLPEELRARAVAIEAPPEGVEGGVAEAPAAEPLAADAPAAEAPAAEAPAAEAPAAEAPAAEAADAEAPAEEAPVAAEAPAEEPRPEAQG